MTTIESIQCPHIRQVVADVRVYGVRISSEFAESGWVNVSCPVCKKCYEMVLDGIDTRMASDETEEQEADGDD